MIPPQAALFDPGEASAGLPVCDHYAGVEARMAKSLALQAELGPVFDVTLDCEDGAPVGAEAAHAELVSTMVMSAANAHGRCGVRVHPVGQPTFAADVATIVGAAASRLAYVMVPKVDGVADVARAAAAVDAAGGARVPLHVLVETSVAKAACPTGWTRTPQRPWTLAADSTMAVTRSACAASAPTGAPSSQSRVTSNTGPSSAWRARLFVIRASTPA